MRRNGIFCESQIQTACLLVCTFRRSDYKLSKKDRVIVPENGPFVINYPASKAAAPTGTANPTMIKEWPRIFQKITSAKMKIETPLLNKTKAGVMLESQEPKLIEHTLVMFCFIGFLKCLRCTENTSQYIYRLDTEKDRARMFHKTSKSLQTNL